MEGMGISCTESVGSYLDEGSGADADSDTNDEVHPVEHDSFQDSGRAAPGDSEMCGTYPLDNEGQDTRMCESWSKGALTSPNSLSRR